MDSDYGLDINITELSLAEVVKKRNNKTEEAPEEGVVIAPEEKQGENEPEISDKSEIKASEAISNEKIEVQAPKDEKPAKTKNATNKKKTMDLLNDDIDL